VSVDKDVATNRGANYPPIHRSRRSNTRGRDKKIGRSGGCGRSP